MFKEPEPSNYWPITVEAAAQEFLSYLEKDDLNYLRNWNEDNNDPHVDMWMCRSMRNNFGLWQDNKRLLEDTGKEHPDDASRIIFNRVVILAKTAK